MTNSFLILLCVLLTFGCKEWEDDSYLGKLETQVQYTNGVTNINIDGITESSEHKVYLPGLSYKLKINYHGKITWDYTGELFSKIIYTGIPRRNSTWQRLLIFADDTAYFLGE